MHPAEAQIIELAKHLVAVSIQAAQAYNGEQSKLQLDLVLSQSRLSSTAGTQESLLALEQLSALTTAHKTAFEKLVVASSSQVSKCICELPEELREDYLSRFVGTVNWHLSAQSDFYANRERWINAAREMCSLVEARRETSRIGEEGIIFAEDQDFKHFQSLLAIIDETHQIEVTRLNERLDRIAKSASVLGLRPSQ